MRYVVLVFVLASFVLWDVTQNDTRYLHRVGRVIDRVIGPVI